MPGEHGTLSAMTVSAGGNDEGDCYWPFPVIGGTGASVSGMNVDVAACYVFALRAEWKQLWSVRAPKEADRE